MQPIPVDSTTLSAVVYDAYQQLLQLEFRGGTVYQYFQVPRQTYQDLLQADSKGAYFNHHIRGAFRCARLGARSVTPRSQSVVSS